MAKVTYPSQVVARVAFVVAIVSLLVSTWALLRPAHVAPRPGSDERESALQRMKREGVLRAGYGGFPPYTIIDVNEQDPNKRVRGFTVDIINEIAARHDPKLRVEWHKLNWETLCDRYAFGEI